jgi:hypothetical protein
MMSPPRPSPQESQETTVQEAQDLCHGGRAVILTFMADRAHFEAAIVRPHPCAE